MFMVGGEGRLEILVIKTMIMAMMIAMMMFCQLMLISATSSFATNTYTTSHSFCFAGEAICHYMFTIVIENSFEPLYCTEKLINALLCGTVPSYR